nr:hypothetical protein [Tanacetum cinerariifolium]
ISSGSTTTHCDISFSEYDSFIFDLSNDQFPPTNRSDFANEEFADELAHIISPLEYDRFYFWNLPDPGELMSILNSRICKNLSTTRVNLPIEDDHSPLWHMLYGSFLLISRIPLFLLIFTHSGMKIPSLTQASSLIVFIRLSLVYLIVFQYYWKLKDSCQRILSSKSSFPQLQLGIIYYSCSKESVEDKVLVPKPPKNCARCAKCGHPVNGPYCQGCSLLPEKLEEDLVTYLKYFQDTFESSNDSTNVFNAPREPFVVKQDHGVYPPRIDECCCECGNVLDGIYCQQCICKSCGKGAHIGYNCPPKVPIISNPEPCNQTMNNELPQTSPSFDSMCYSDKEKSVPCVSKPNTVDESSNIFNPPPQPPIYSCEFCGSNAQYGHYCTPQASFINPEPGYSQDFNFSQNIHDFQQHYFCCDQCRGPHETFQCQQEIFYEPCCENCGGPHENFPDDDSLYKENIEYVEASPCDSELVSLEAAEIVILEEEEIEDDNLREKLLNFTPTDRSDFANEEFVDELAHIISPLEYDRFYFCNLPDPGLAIM